MAHQHADHAASTLEAGRRTREPLLRTFSLGHISLKEAVDQPLVQVGLVVVKHVQVAQDSVVLGAELAVYDVGREVGCGGRSNVRCDCCVDYGADLAVYDVAYLNTGQRPIAHK